MPIPLSLERSERPRHRGRRTTAPLATGRVRAPAGELLSRLAQVFTPNCWPRERPKEVQNPIAAANRGGFRDRCRIEDIIASGRWGLSDSTPPAEATLGGD